MSSIIKPRLVFSEFQKFILKSLEANKADMSANFIQLATNGINGGFPSARTTIFRGFHNDMIKIASNINTNKINELKENALSQICWYFPITREQYRISCITYVINTEGIVNKSSISKVEGNEKELNEIEKSLIQLREDNWNAFDDYTLSLYKKKEDYVLVLFKLIDAQRIDTINHQFNQF